MKNKFNFAHEAVMKSLWLAANHWSKFGSKIDYTNKITFTSVIKIGNSLVLSQNYNRG